MTISLQYSGAIVELSTGFQITPYTIRPFDETELRAADRARLRNFNEKLSSARIISEHAFGEIKGRFPALKNLPGCDVVRTYLSVEAMFIMHNIFKIIGDKAEDIPDFDPHDHHAAALVSSHSAAHAVADPVANNHQRHDHFRHQGFETAEQLREDGESLRRSIMLEIERLQAAGML